ncbi:hypothetical protein DyAD56_18035 [Dyella sp. AD56]|nr:hypothetical protein DyAD56_18035 [Dyella sp. AD56]
MPAAVPPAPHPTAPETGHRDSFVSRAAADRSVDPAVREHHAGGCTTPLSERRRSPRTDDCAARRHSRRTAPAVSATGPADLGHRPRTGHPAHAPARPVTSHRTRCGAAPAPARVHPRPDAPARLARAAAPPDRTPMTRTAHTLPPVLHRARWLLHRTDPAASAQWVTVPARLAPDRPRSLQIACAALRAAPRCDQASAVALPLLTDPATVRRLRCGRPHSLTRPADPGTIAVAVTTTRARAAYDPRCTDSRLLVDLQTARYEPTRQQSQRRTTPPKRIPHHTRSPVWPLTSPNELNRSPAETDLDRDLADLFPTPPTRARLFPAAPRYRHPQHHFLLAQRCPPRPTAIAITRRTPLN